MIKVIAIALLLGIGFLGVVDVAAAATDDLSESYPPDCYVVYKEHHVSTPTGQQFIVRQPYFICRL